MILKKAPSSAKEGFRRSWRVVVATTIGNCGGQLLNYSFGVFIDPMSLGLGWSRSTISGFSFFANVGYLLSASATGRLIDRIGARPVVLMAIPLLSLAWASLSLVGGSVWTLYLAALAVGCIATGATIVPYSRAINSWFEAGRGAALGLMACGPGLVSTFGPRIFQSFVDAHGWRTGFLVIGVAGLVPLPVMALFLHERREAAETGVPVPETGYTRQEAIRQPVFWLMAVASFFWLFAFGHVMHLVSFLTSSGLTRTEAATYAGVLGATSIVGRVVTGFVIDRVNVPLFCALVFSLQAAALVALGLFHARFALVAIALMGFSHGAENDCIPYLTAGYFGLKCFGEIFGLIVMATVIGSALGPFTFGFIREVSGADTLPYIIMAGCAGAAAILMACVRRHPYLV